MNTLTRPLTWIAAAALTVASLPAMALEPFKADYLASYMGMQANGTMTLSSEGANKWRYSLQVKNQLADLSLRDKIYTADNEHGLLTVSTHVQDMVLACPSVTTGHVRVELYGLRKTVVRNPSQAEKGCANVHQLFVFLTTFFHCFL